jgi:tol-pal system protein YbgF
MATLHRPKGSPRLPFTVFPALACLLFVAAGCAGVADDATQQDVAQLRRDVNALKLSTNLGRGQTDAVAQVERRSREQSADTNRQLTALSTRLEAIAAELNRVSARLDDLSRRVDAGGRQSSVNRPPTSGGSAVVPPPISAPEIPPAAAPAPSVRVMPPAPAPSTPAPPATPPVSGSAPVAPPATPAIPPSSGSPPSATAPTAPPGPRATPPASSRAAAGASAEESYQSAYLDFSRGRYELAMSGFRDFLRRYPDSPLADSAQYGIGESYYSVAAAATSQGQADKATRALEQAVQEFRKVIVIYPRGSKVPSALYKEALSLTELKQTALARARLQYLVEHFPQSEEAPLAKERLATLK